MPSQAADRPDRATKQRRKQGKPDKQDKQTDKLLHTTHHTPTSTNTPFNCCPPPSRPRGKDCAANTHASFSPCLLPAVSQLWSKKGRAPGFCLVEATEGTLSLPLVGNKGLALTSLFLRQLGKRSCAVRPVQKRTRSRTKAGADHTRLASFYLAPSRTSWRGGRLFSRRWRSAAFPYLIIYHPATHPPVKQRVWSDQIGRQDLT